MARPARGSPWTKRVIVPQDYADARPGPVAASFRGKTNERSFFRRASLARAIDNDRWGRRLCQKPFDCESRKEATRLCQGRCRLGVAPLRRLSSRQHGVGNVGRVSRVDGMLKLLDRRFKPTPANLGKAQIHVPDVRHGGVTLRPSETGESLR